MKRQLLHSKKTLLYQVLLEGNYSETIFQKKLHNYYTDPVSHT